MKSLNHSNNIKQLAIDSGFEACGISHIENLSQDRTYLEKWIKKGNNADLHYMENNIEKRENPSLMVDGAKSVISVILNYYPEKKLQSGYQISKYAYGVDYHFVIKEKLKPIEDYILKHFPESANRRFTDSAPVFDKAWATKAGLGWVGKNSMLINPKKGSFFFVGEIITSADLTPDVPFKNNHCGTCTKCLEACPTNAIENPYEINANKCISYWTIETKDDIPENLTSKFGDWIYGCDICQDVCPWNSKAKPHNVEEFKLSDELALFKNEDWDNLDKETFNRLFKKSAVKRAGYEKLKRNIELNSRFSESSEQ